MSLLQETFLYPLTQGSSLHLPWILEIHFSQYSFYYLFTLHPSIMSLVPTEDYTYSLLENIAKLKDMAHESERELKMCILNFKKLLLSLWAKIMCKFHLIMWNDFCCAFYFTLQNNNCVEVLCPQWCYSLPKHFRTLVSWANAWNTLRW